MNGDAAPPTCDCAALRARVEKLERAVTDLYRLTDHLTRKESARP